MKLNIVLKIQIDEHVSIQLKYNILRNLFYFEQEYTDGSMKHFIPNQSNRIYKICAICVNG